MKNFIVILLLLVSCVPTFAVTRKKAAPKKKQVEKVVDKHPGQFRNTKVWNISDCEPNEEGDYLFAASPEKGVNKFIILNSNGELESALSKVSYTDGHLVETFKSPNSDNNNIVISTKTDRLLIIEKDYSSDKEYDKLMQISSGNSSLLIMKKRYGSTFIVADSIEINGVKKELDVDHEYRNTKEVWNMYQLLSKKFDKLYEYNQDNEYYNRDDRELNSFIKIAKDDFQFYKGKGYLDE